MQSAHPQSHHHRRRRHPKRPQEPKPVVELQPCLSKEDINLLPIRSWGGEIVLVQDETALNSALDQLWNEPVLC